MKFIFAKARKLPSKKSKKSGAQGRNRTTDTGIFSPLLYQLSYLGTRHQIKYLSLNSIKNRKINQILFAAHVHQLAISSNQD